MASLDFWLMLLPKAMLFTYTQFFMNYIPQLLHASYGYDHGQAASLGGVAQGGSVIGLLVVGNMIYKGLAPGGKVKLVALLLAVCAAVPLALSLGPEVLPQPLVVPLAVLWGLAYALPFYIPPGEFAMQIGGKSATGLFSNLFDAAGLARLKTRQVAAATMHLWLRHSVGRRASPSRRCGTRGRRRSRRMATSASCSSRRPSSAPSPSWRCRCACTARRRAPRL